MSQLVQKSGVNFLAKDYFIAFRKIPKVFEEQNNLRWQHRSSVASKFRANEQSKCIHLNSISLQSSIRYTFKRHRQLPRLLTQRFRQRGQRRLDFCQSQKFYSFPVCNHETILQLSDLQGKFSLALPPQTCRQPNLAATFCDRFDEVFTNSAMQITIMHPPKIAGEKWCAWRESNARQPA